MAPWKAISLWQPWASAIACGAKRIETRSWETRYRGPLFIHAAKRCNQGELIHYHSCWRWCGALAPLGVRHGSDQNLWDLLPFGAIVAVCNLVDCKPTDEFTPAEIDRPQFSIEYPDRPFYAWTEHGLGNFALGRFGWVLENAKAFHEPIPLRGSRGLFNVPYHVIKGPLGELDKCGAA
jgi:hypothetical protein